MLCGLFADDIDHSDVYRVDENFKKSFCRFDRRRGIERAMVMRNEYSRSKLATSAALEDRQKRPLWNYLLEASLVSVNICLERRCKGTR